MLSRALLPLPPVTEAPAAEAAKNKTTAAERRSKMSRRASLDAAKGAEGAKTIPSMTLNPVKAEAASSNLLATVFSSLDAIKEPGTVTKTGALDMQEVVTLLSAGQFQR